MPENNQKYIRCAQLTQDAFLYDLFISFGVQYIYPLGPAPHYLLKTESKVCIEDGHRLRDPQLRGTPSSC